MPRPEKPIITRGGAAEAALAVIDAEGLDRFGLNLVAERLGVRTPSLYHHFRGKSEVLAEVARLMLREAELPVATPDLDWRAEIERISLASWRSVLRHPNAAPLLLRFFPRVVLTGAYEHWARIFTMNGVPAEWQITILEGSEKLTFGSALFAAAAQELGVDAYVDKTPDKHPCLSAALAAHGKTDEETFVTCLQAFLRGVPV